MAKTSEANLTSLYHELHKFAQNGDYSNPRALNVANKILKASREDETAFQCKIVCLIHQSQFQIALKEMANNPALALGFHFEKAYCQYRLNKITEALNTIRAVSEPGPKLLELLGQVLYRLEQYDECLDVYKSLIKNTSDDYEEERQTNLSAVIAGLKLWDNKDVDDFGLREDTYELSYNRACLLIGQGDYPAALKQLEHAEALCREMMEEEGEDIEAELGVIHVQRAYILQIQGKNDEALKLYNQVVKARPSDIGLMAVASANIISLNKDQNVFDSKKKVKSTTVPGLENKLTKGQRSAISYNRFLLLLYTNQFDQCRKLLNILRSEKCEEDLLCLLEAGLLCRQKQVPKAIQLIEGFIAGKGNVSLHVKLTVAQLYLLQGNISKACEMLQSLGGSSHKPGVVSTLVALFTGMEDTQGAVTVLDEAVEWYKSHGGPHSELNTLLRENTAFKLRTGQSQAATSMLEDLRESNPGDIKTLAQLISAYSKFDPKRAQELSHELPSVAQLSGDVDVDQLENTPLTLSTRQLRKGAKGDAADKTGVSASTEEMKKKRKRKRKPHLPKNFDPSVAPDPERWLPMRERSHFKGKRRRDKKGGVGKGTQGATSGGADMDASKTGNVPDSPRPGSSTSSVTASPSATVTPRQQKPAPSSKKNKAKKKKGGKW